VAIDKSYFETLGIGTQRGRAFTAQDGEAGRETAIVNQRFADKYFSNQTALGKRIQLRPSATSPPPQPWLTIVGISPNIRQRPLPDPDPVVYVAIQFEPPALAAIMLRGPANPAAVLTAVREKVRAVDSDLPLYRPMTLEQAKKESGWNGRLSNLLAALITLVAVGLAAVGLYAVTAHGVVQRTQEIGIRLALGAQPTQVIWMVLRRTMLQLVVGLAVGIACVFAWERAFGTSTGYARQRMTDPEGLVFASAVLLVIAVFACLAPVRRATHINPVTALRYE